MRTKWIAAFLIFSFLFQCSVFALLNWKAERLLNPSFRFDKAYSLKIDVKNAHHFGLSYNNRYLAFIVEGSLQILDLTNHNVIFNAPSPREAAFILGYKWLPDRNNLVYLAKNKLDESQGASLYSLDLDTALASRSSGALEPQLERILNLAIQKILSIEVSTYTNNLYILYRDENRDNKLIAMDIMKNINRIDNPGEPVLALAVSNKFGTVYAESESEGQKAIFSVQGREWKIVTDNPGEILLGCRDNLLFIGKKNGDMLREIRLYSQEPADTLPKEVLWQGSILFNQPEVLISLDHKVFLQSNHGFDAIYPDGSHISKETEKNTIVISPTGKMYLEIWPDEKKYYWRPL